MSETIVIKAIEAKCRVCGDGGRYDLQKTAFRCLENDIMLIEAFGNFSSTAAVSSPSLFQQS